MQKQREIDEKDREIKTNERQREMRVCTVEIRYLRSLNPNCPWTDTQLSLLPQLTGHTHLSSMPETLNGATTKNKKN